jgi:GNAT superfamily N-acetyltransferase
MVRALPVLGYHRLVFFEASLRPPLPTPPSSVPLEFDFLGREGLDELVAFRPRVEPAELERRFDLGERCFVARTEGRIVCACWAHRRNRKFREISYELVVSEDAVYVFDAFTSPTMRGKRIASVVRSELNNRLAAEGYARSLSYVLGGNSAGLLNAQRSGSQETWRVATLKLGPLPPIRMPYWGPAPL